MRILRLTLAGFDLDAQEDFYGERLGLPVRRDRSGALEVDLRFSVVRFERSYLATDARHHFAINIPPETIDKAARWVESWGDVLAFHGDRDQEDGTKIVRRDSATAALYFLDVDGNVVELISAPHMESTDSDSGAFGPGSLIDVAEIGIATSDLASTRSAVEGFFGEPRFWGGTADFPLTAIGDEHAIVLITPTGRGWIPVGVPARPLPTGILVAGEEDRELILPEGPYTLLVRR